MRQAEAIARHLVASRVPFDALYSSPLRRAWQTAEVVGHALGLSPVAHEGLKEIWFGKVEGLTLEMFAARYPEIHRHWGVRDDVSFTWPGGESRAEFHRRTRQAIEEITDWHEGQSVVIVAHGGTLRAILADLFPVQLGRWWTHALDNCSLTRVQLAPEGSRLVVLNDQSHLAGPVVEGTRIVASALPPDEWLHSPFSTLRTV